MNQKDKSRNKKGKFNKNIISKLEDINSKYILKKIFNNLSEKKLLKIICYNKNIQNKLKLNINDYIDFRQIIIEIIPVKDYFSEKINIIILFSNLIEAKFK